MKEEYIDYLDDIQKSAEKIRDFTQNIDFDRFAEDEKTSDAVIRNFEIIGEASKKIPEEIQDKNPELPWSQMAGMRDKLIHGYTDVDLEIVWKTAKDEIPELLKELRKLRSDAE